MSNGIVQLVISDLVIYSIQHDDDDELEIHSDVSRTNGFYRSWNGRIKWLTGCRLYESSINTGSDDVDVTDDGKLFLCSRNAPEPLKKARSPKVALRRRHDELKRR